jgi:hypothetical protein
MFLTPEQVDLLPSEKLRPLLKALLAEFESLRQRVASLEAENERLKQQLKGSTNSRNFSQPPSRDQKLNHPSDKPKKKHGPPFGHQKFSRPILDNPDRVIKEQAAAPQPGQPTPIPKSPADSLIPPDDLNDYGLTTI